MDFKICLNSYSNKRHTRKRTRASVHIWGKTFLNLYRRKIFISIVGEKKKKSQPENSLDFYNFHVNWNELIFVVQLLTHQDKYILFFFCKNVYVRRCLLLKNYAKLLDYDLFS
jgi:hypothetical protein